MDKWSSVKKVMQKAVNKPDTRVASLSKKDRQPADTSASDARAVALEVHREAAASALANLGYSSTYANVLVSHAMSESSPKQILDPSRLKYNLFGRKSKKGEPFQTLSTTEIVDGKVVRLPQNFKTFPSLAAAYEDQVKYYLRRGVTFTETSHDAVRYQVFHGTAKQGNYATLPWAQYKSHWQKHALSLKS